MRILYVCSVYLPNTGGCQDPIDQVGQRFLAAGHDVHVLTKRWPEYLPETEVIHGLTVHRVTSPILPTEFRELVTPVARLLRDHAPDAVHAIGLRRPLPAVALLAARASGAPAVMTVGGWDIPDPRDPEPEKVWRTGAEFIPPAMRHADRVTGASADLARLTEETLPDLAPVGVTYVGIDYAYFANADPYPYPRPYVLALRRLESSKGIDRLLTAFRTIAGRHPELDLLVAGDGAERSNLVRLAGELGLGERVRFTGEVPLETAARLLRGAAMTVVPSLAEGGGLVNVEAQAAGCPVIASRVGGITEYVQGESGAHLLEAPEPASIAAAIEQVWTDAPYRHRLIEVGRELARRFDWSRLSEEYLDLYQSLAPAARSRSLEPWSPLVDLLDRDIRAQREGAGPDEFAAEWERQRRDQQRLLASAPAAFRSFGRGALRWYYAGLVAGHPTGHLDEVAAQCVAELSGTDPTVVDAALSEAAEWGRFDLAEVTAYVDYKTRELAAAGGAR
ncbi:glycosyltransferase family 4 protein [Streptomyces albus]|uniref:glycosyltransferase family 4 protein n=1 Tax=Streptomyces albus TaxID=1888 RepID=UPI003F19E5F0